MKIKLIGIPSYSGGFRGYNLIKIIIIAFLIIIIFRFNKNVLVKSASENGQNSIKVTTSSKMFFGEENISIIANKKGLKNIFKFKTYKTKISNDGKNISEKNINIKWSGDNNVIINLNGEEQPQEVIQITFSDSILIK